jgi:hypothetical protein
MKLYDTIHKVAVVVEREVVVTVVVTVAEKVEEKVEETVEVGKEVTTVVVLYM